MYYSRDSENNYCQNLDTPRIILFPLAGKRFLLIKYALAHLQVDVCLLHQCPTIIGNMTKLFICLSSEGVTRVHSSMIVCFSHYVSVTFMLSCSLFLDKKLRVHVNVGLSHHTSRQKIFWQRMVVNENCSGFILINIRSVMIDNYYKLLVAKKIA